MKNTFKCHKEIKNMLKESNYTVSLKNKKVLQEKLWNINFIYYYRLTNSN